MRRLFIASIASLSVLLLIVCCEGNSIKEDGVTSDSISKDRIVYTDTLLGRIIFNQTEEDFNCALSCLKREISCVNIGNVSIPIDEIYAEFEYNKLTTLVIPYDTRYVCKVLNPFMNQRLVSIRSKEEKDLVRYLDDKYGDATLEEKLEKTSVEDSAYTTRIWKNESRIIELKEYYKASKYVRTKTEIWVSDDKNEIYSETYDIYVGSLHMELRYSVPSMYIDIKKQLKDRLKIRNKEIIRKEKMLKKEMEYSKNL